MSPPFISFSYSPLSRYFSFFYLPSLLPYISVINLSFCLLPSPPHKQYPLIKLCVCVLYSSFPLKTFSLPYNTIKLPSASFLHPSDPCFSSPTCTAPSLPSFLSLSSSSPVIPVHLISTCGQSNECRTPLIFINLQGPCSVGRGMEGWMEGLLSIEKSRVFCTKELVLFATS